MEINVVNKYTRKPEVNDVYIGRGSPLGNPYPITQTESRDKVCDQYHEHLKNRTTCMNTQLATIIKVGKQFGSVNLVCFCAPLRCHGSDIKAAVEAILATEEKTNGS